MDERLTSANYLASLTAALTEYQDFPQITAKIQAVKETVLAYQRRQLPAQPLPPLEFPVDLTFDLLDSHPDILTVESRLNDLRECVIENFGVWHLFSQPWVEDLATYLGDRPTVQLMAGNGLLASQIQTVHATDNLDWQGQDITQPQPWTTIEQLDALAAVKKYYQTTAVFILEWSPDGVELDAEILQFLRDQQWSGEFLVIGEANGATNSARFWHMADYQVIPVLNRQHQQFDFINDQVFIVH